MYIGCSSDDVSTNTISCLTPPRSHDDSTVKLSSIFSGVLLV